MIQRTSSTMFALVLAIGMVASLAAPAYAGGPCSLARAAGHWSLTDNGTVIGLGPRTAVGVFTLDSSGNLLDGVAASSLNGAVATETFSGTYSVNPDCSGSFDVKIFSGSTELFEIKAFIALDDDSKELRAVFTSVTTADGTALPTVINLNARKQ